MKLKIVKRNLFDKTVFRKTGLACSLKIRDGGFKPYGLLKVELDTGLFKSVIHLVRAGIGRVVFDGYVFNHMIAFK